MKKIMDLIFEPIEEEKEEKIDIPNIVSKTSEIKTSVKEVKKVAPITYSEPKKEVVKNVKENDVLSRKSVSHISIDVTPKKPIRKVEYDKDYKYESQPALSPIFGIIESKGSHPKFTAPNITGQKTTKSKIGTILSPIYGAIEADKEEDLKQASVTIKETKSANDFENYSLDDLLKED